MVGTDIIEVNRIENAMQDENFALRVFTQNEIAYCEKFKGKTKYQHYAARFAAKEAVFKAISFTLNSKYDIDFKDIEVLNDKDGRPYIRILNADKLPDEVKKLKINVSLSHIEDYAIAVVETK